MNVWIDKINKLDLDLFKVIHSQTTPEDRRSLLAVQRATAANHNEYAYLEIGSYLGGSIQPHLVDDRCIRIYAIDQRSSQVSDDRSHSNIVNYGNNTTENMISLLKGIGYGDLSKLYCFDSDASRLDVRNIDIEPILTFIDGQHTNSAVLSDFEFCYSIINEKGTILFHDFNIIYKAILEIRKQLRKSHQKPIFLKLEGEIFAIFLDKEKILNDRYLMSLYKKNMNFLFIFQIKLLLKKFLPLPLQKFVRIIRNYFRNIKSEKSIIKIH